MEINNKLRCELCNKNYNTLSGLWKHNKKFHKESKSFKSPLVGPSKSFVSPSVSNRFYMCKFCNKTYNNKNSKWSHQNKCKSNSNILQKNKYIKTPQIKNNNIIKNSNVNTFNKSNCNNKTIIINNYGNDNLEYISEKFKDKLFKNLLDNEEHNIPLPKLIENIKFNPNHKENNNVKIKSDRSKIGFYYDENKWKALNKSELLDDLCNYSLKILSKYFEEKKDNLSEDTINQYKQFSHIAKLKSELREEIKKKIENIAYIFTLNNEDQLDV